MFKFNIKKCFCIGFKIKRKWLIIHINLNNIKSINNIFGIINYLKLDYNKNDWHKYFKSIGIRLLGLEFYVSYY